MSSLISLKLKYFKNIYKFYYITSHELSIRAGRISVYEILLAK